MKLLVVLCLAAGLAATGAAGAATYDATADFSAATTTNPNGVWRYGYDPVGGGYNFTAFNLFTASATGPAWQENGYITLGTPAFAKNTSTGVINGVAAGQAFLHPGPTANDDAAILRFTAPTTGVYNVAIKLFAGDSGETDGWLVLNSNFTTPFATLGVTSANPTYNNAALALNAGDTFDIVVGNHGAFNFDSTPLTEVITLAVPEPGTAAMLLAGLCFVGWQQRRRRR